jgi:hypothetical protein
MLVDSNGLVEIIGSEVGPEATGEMEFGVGRTPEEKVGEAILSPCPNDEIGKGVGDGRDLGMEGFGGDVVWREEASFDPSCEDTYGFRDLFLTSIRKGEREHHAVVVGRSAGQLAKRFSDSTREFVPIADGSEMNLVAENLFPFGEEIVLEEVHQGIDFVFGTAPILFRKSIKGEVLDAEPAGSADNTAHGMAACAMSCGAGFGSEFGPAAVAIHDDGDVAWEFACVDEGHGGSLGRITSGKGGVGGGFRVSGSVAR